MLSAAPPIPPSPADGLTGPLPCLLNPDIVAALQHLRIIHIAGLTQNEAFHTLGVAQTLAHNILTSAEPPDYINLDQDTQFESQTLTAERDAARRDSAAHAQRAATLSDQLTQALTIGPNNNNNGNHDHGEGKDFPDIFLFNGTDPSQIRAWIDKLRIKMAAEERRYPSEQAQLRYAFSRLSGAAFNQVRSYLDESTGTIRMDTLNDFIAKIRAVYDDPDRANTALKKLKIGTKFSTFPLYLAEFRRLVGDLDLNDAAQKQQLEDGLTPALKNAIILRDGITTLTQMVAACQEMDAAFCAQEAEQGTTRSTNQPRPPNQAPRPVPASTPTGPSSVHPTDTNSGNYGAAPMNLSAAEKQKHRTERMARGECTYCGTLGHFRINCAQRLAKEARDLRIAQLGPSTPAAAAPAAAAAVAPAAPASGNALSPTAELATVGTTI
jgi:hypothetical protein